MTDGIGRFTSEDLSHQRRNGGRPHHHQPDGKEPTNPQTDGLSSRNPIGHGKGGEKTVHGEQEHDLQWQTEQQTQSVHFQLGHRILRLKQRHQALTQEPQEQQTRKDEESFGWRSIGCARAVGQGVPSIPLSVQDHDRRRPDQDAIEHCHDHLG